MNRSRTIFKDLKKSARFMAFFSFYARNGVKKRVFIIRNLGQFSFYTRESIFLRHRVLIGYNIFCVSPVCEIRRKRHGFPLRTRCSRAMDCPRFRSNLTLYFVLCMKDSKPLWRCGLIRSFVIFDGYSPA